jgi:hypothetical protein
VAILGCAQVIEQCWPSILYPLRFDAKGEFRTGGFSVILSPLLTLMDLGWFTGLPFLFVGVAGLVFLYGKRSTRFAVVRSRPLTSAALAVVVFAHAIVFAISAQFFFVPAGAHIRPMGWAMFVAAVSFVSLLLVVPVSIVATIRERPRSLGFVGLLGGITPFFFSSLILHLAAWLKGFELSP